MRQAVTIDGTMLGAPILTSAMALTCNQKVFDAVGQQEYPATWDDLPSHAAYPVGQRHFTEGVTMSGIKG